MPNAKPRIAVYTGSFDPITLGHLNVIERAAALVDKLFVGAGINIGKEPMFTIDERVDLIRRATKHLKNVEVRSFDGLAVQFVRDCGARRLRLLSPRAHPRTPTQTLRNRAGAAGWPVWPICPG